MELLQINRQVLLVITIAEFYNFFKVQSMQIQRAELKGELYLLVNWQPTQETGHQVHLSHYPPLPHYHHHFDF